MTDFVVLLLAGLVKPGGVEGRSSSPIFLRLAPHTVSIKRASAAAGQKGCGRRFLVMQKTLSAIILEKAETHIAAARKKLSRQRALVDRLRTSNAIGIADETRRAEDVLRVMEDNMRKGIVASS